LQAQAADTSSTKYSVLLNLSFGGAVTGTAADGLYLGGAYSGGSQAASFTISSIVTQLGGR
jgi:hypothetical protein